MKLLLALLPFLLLSQSCSDADKLDRVLQKAEALAQEGRYEEAVAYLSSFEEEFNTVPLYFSDRAFYKWYLHDVNGALRDYESALILDDSNLRYRYNAALCLYQLEQFEEAKEKLNGGLVSETPKISLSIGDLFEVENLILLRAWCNYSIGYLDAALYDVERCMEREFEPGESNFLKASILYDAGMHEEACRHFKASYFYGYPDAKEQMAEWCES